ncbi:MAG: PorP/SprF family type IX secretion system membrane protein [Candidatus Cyclobacteriaceae bacterium M2_1C_046]
MNFRNILIVIALMGASMKASGQDPQFSQYYAAPLYLNPGFTGTTEQQRVIINHRVQWPSLPQAFSTYSASYEFYDNNLNSGFGFLATTDAMGSAGWRTTFVGLSYSFKARLGNNWVFSPGLNFSYGVNGLDRTRLVMRDGLIHGDGVSYDPELNRLGNSSFMDFSAGAVLYNKEWWFGVAGHHMNRPNISVIGDESELPMKVTVHGGVRVPMYNGPKKFTDVHYLTPSFIYRTQGNSFHQLDAGLRYHIDPIAIGLWYRGIPVFGDNEEDGMRIIQRDALAFIASLTYEGFQFGYSFDFSVSAEQTATGGAHEISLSYEFARKSKKRLKKRDMLIPCPSFLR